MSYIKFFDTTLRDGEQSPGVALNTQQKLEIAFALAKLGVDIIEAGFPITSEGDFECVDKIAREVRGPVIAALARTHKLDIERAAKAIEPADRGRIHIFTSASDVHLEYMLRKTRAEVLALSQEMVEYAKTFTDDVEFSAQDCMRADPEFVYQLVRTAIAAGATTVNIPDTTGYGTPQDYGALIRSIFANVPEARGVSISTHCHDDLGLATANTLAAVENGATQVEVAVNGIGERAGNTSLEEVAMALYTRRDHFGHDIGINTRELYRVSRLVSRYTGMLVQPNKAIVGENAFAHEAGIHQDGVIKNKSTYEIMNAELVGREAGVLVMGKHSGRNAFRQRLGELGYVDLSAEQLNELFKQFKELADLKQSVTTDDLRALVENEIVKVAETYKLDHLQFQSGMGGMTPQALVRLRTPAELLEATATGSGPVDAAYKALATLAPIPFELESYDLKAIGSGTDALGEVTIRATADGRTLYGRAISTDVVHSSVLAYVDVINKLAAGVGRAKVEAKAVTMALP
ncbi:MAG: 2-isopropylmalate synthase [Trueperaceae bacterium]|nr:2-isopropylmalate synthase [Trueperaceae bacterium]MCO5174340.1 2-isopropylmalate synthase [Trueperaceae bacterium]MCW5820325.1 2-isopropylmalate synthase [Trueperaceae bacterium]